MRIIEDEIEVELELALQEKYLGRLQQLPASSCRQIQELSPDTESGYYYLNNSIGAVIRVYCDMDLACGPSGNITGWMRVANFDLDDPNQSCPPGNFDLVTEPDRYCVRRMNNFGCDSSIFSVNHVPYTQVCGRAAGIQIGTVDGFLDREPMRSIDDVYTDGVSLTTGFGPRTHIWTFAASISEVFLTCPCSVNALNQSPPYVGEHYFCESGATTATVGNFVFPDDKLWDGQMCRDMEAPCCSGNFRPPWFYRDLGSEQMSDIEMRLCIDQGGGDEDVGLKAIEVYVQ